MSSGGLWLNCGSGQRPFAKPWVNIDAQARWEPDLVADCSHLPYADASCEMIVLSHVLEHFGCGEGRGLLSEARRLLHPGGGLIITVPDLRALAQAWLMGKLDTQVYVTNLYGAYMGDDHDRHRWGFIHESLVMELQQCGPWQEIKPFNWRAITGANIAHDFWILGVEALR
jgi:predicted SAM-dependent methyltransferase